MNWTHLRAFPWLDTRAHFVARAPKGGHLLDLGSSDGETLRHFAELRPDLNYFAVDIQSGLGEYPKGCDFKKLNVEQDKFPWSDGSMDAITCMHLVEHLKDLAPLFAEASRLLKAGGRIYVETPHPKSLVLQSAPGDMAGAFPMSFYDDATHVRIVTTGILAQHAKASGMQVLCSGISRNWLFAAACPFLAFARPSRRSCTARLHWIGWSAYFIAQKPIGSGENTNNPVARSIP